MSGIFWGLPPFDYKEYHPDEPKIILGAYNFPEDITTRRDLRYPTAYHYILGLIVYPLKKGLEAIGYPPYYLIYLIGRVLTVIAGTATILLVYLLASTIFDVRHGRYAGIILTFSMFHITHSAWATTDVVSGFFLTAALLSLMKTVQTPSIQRALLTGALLGMLVGTKYTGAIAVIPYGMMLIYRHKRTWSGSLSRFILTLCTDRIVWIITITALAIFFLSTPGILLHPTDFLASIQAEQARMSQLHLPLSDFSIWKNQFLALAQTLGIPLACIACSGVLASFLKRPAIELSLGVMVCAFSVLFRNALLPRYIILIMPVLAILSSRIFLFKTSPKQHLLQLIWQVGTVLIFGYTLLYSACAIAARYPDTRTDATEFIFDQLPSGASIGIAYTSQHYPYPYHGWRYPFIDFTRFPYRDFLSFPQYVIVSSYDAEQIKDTLTDGILSKTYEFPEALTKQWYQNSPPEPEIFRFFETLYFQDNSPYRLIAQFRQKPYLVSIEFPPPAIDIFELRSIRPEHTALP